MIMQRFKRHAATHPLRCAVKTADRDLSYRDLYRYTQNIAAALSSVLSAAPPATALPAGLTAVGGSSVPAPPQRTVALLFEQGVDMIAGVMATLTAAEIYVPFDPGYPHKRLAHMLADSEASILMTNPANLDTAKRLIADAPHPVCLLVIGEENAGENLADNVDGKDLIEENSAESVDGDADRQLTATPLLDSGQGGIGGKIRQDGQSGEDGIAYILYTSGSTGKPKGVMQSRRNIVHFIDCYTSDLGLTHDDRMTLFSSFSHDAAVMDIFGALLNGATLYPLNIKEQDISGIPQWLKSEGITIYHSVPTVYRYFLDTLTTSDAFPALRWMVLGGEAVLPDDVFRFQKYFTGSDAKLMNLYGQSESSYNSAQVIGTGETFERILLGTPVNDTQLLVIDDEGEEVRPFQEGEIVVISNHVALGYWRDPEKTEMAFDEDGELGRLYFTGDKGRLLLDDAIEFVGRTDLQIKIRGYRVELGEIETALLGHDSVKEAVVSAETENDGNTLLCAYLVAEPGSVIDAAQLREYLGREVLEHMVPAYFVQLEQMPRTATGKTDRKALKEVGGTLMTGSEFAAPTDEVESRLVELWQQLLNLEQVGIDDHFFNVGGHSLKATVLAAKVQQAFDVHLPLKEIFRSPTVRGMARYIRAAAATHYQEIPVAPAQSYYPLSAVQRRLFALHRLEQQGTGYNMPAAVTVSGPLDRERLENAFRQLMDTHESLRTAFEWLEGQPVQKILTESQYQFSIEDLPPLPPGEDLDAIMSRFIRPFHLGTAPLLRAAIAPLPEPDRCLLLMDMHHIIADGTSRGIMIDHLSRFYEGGDVAKPALRYIDYAVFQQQETLEPQACYWQELLGGPVPVLELPVDHPRPALQSFAGDVLRFQLPRDIGDGLRRTAADTGTTLFMVLLASFYTLLARYTGQEDIITGTAVAGRSHAQLSGVVGMFVNTLALRCAPAEHKSFRVLLEEVKTLCLNAFENQDYPFDLLVEQLDLRRDLSRNPLFDVMFALQNFQRSEAVGRGLTFEPCEFEEKTAKFDLTLTVVEDGPDLGVELEYAVSLFNGDTIQRMAGHFERLLREVVKDPHQELHAIDILDDREKELLLETFNRTDAPLEETVFIRSFHRQVSRTPDALALAGPLPGNGADYHQLSYRELDCQARLWASVMAQRGVGKGDVVALLLEPSAFMISAVLAVLNTGAAFLPMDHRFPEERIRFILADSAAALLITDQPADAFSLPCLDCREPLDEQSGMEPDPVSAASDPAYIIYTSGTTGRPRGVLVEQAALMNLCHWHNSEFSIVPRDRASKYAGFGFDASVWEIFPYLSAGASLVIVDETIKTQVPGLAAFYQRWAITAAFLPTQMCEEFNRSIPHHSSLRLLLAGGDKLRHFSPCNYRFVNNYGPTESTVVTTSHTVTASDTIDTVNIPIGLPVANTRIFILGRHHQLQPIGIAGELCIAGLSLARGYLNHPQLTSEKFPPAPVQDSASSDTTSMSSMSYRSYTLSPPHRLYKTGDLCRRLPSGQLQFLGRIDGQVKIRGFRIETAEIEALLSARPDIRDCTVAALTAPDGEKYLCAYIVSEQPPDPAQLRTDLGLRLPDYMIPAHVVTLDALPLTPSGKVDHRALPDPLHSDTLRDETSYREPATPLEARLLELWRDILGLERIGMEDDFFQRGGHSLKAVRLTAKINQSFHIDIPLKQIFQTPTISGLAAVIEGAHSAAYREIPVAPPAENYPLSAAQNRLYTISCFDTVKTGTAYNMPIALSVTGALDRSRLETAFLRLVQRHESLRTSFHMKADEAVQKIQPAHDCHFRIQDYDAIPPDAISETVSRFVRPFDLTCAPLLRVALAPVGSGAQGQWLLMVDMHHIISDGLSMGLLVKEFSLFYRGDEPDPLRIQYKDFALWQQEEFRSGSIARQAEYWRQHLQGELPVLALPLDYARPAEQSFSGLTRQFPLTALSPLEQLARDRGVTLYVLVLALYNSFLARYTGQEEIVVGTPVSGRRHADLEPVLGMFVNTLALRHFPADGLSFDAFQSQVSERTLEAFENQDYPFEALLEILEIQRDPGRNPLFDTMFTLRDLDIPALQLDDVSLSPLSPSGAVAKFDLTVTALRDGEHLVMEWQYCTALWEEGSIQRMARHFSHLTTAVLEDPAQLIRDIDFISPEERRQLVRDFNAPAAYDPPGQSLVHIFRDQVTRTPDCTALVFAEQQVSYRELERRSRNLALALVAVGMGPGTITAIMVDRSLEMIFGLLAILTSGSAYLPLDPKFPEGRIRHMLRDCGTTVMVAEPGVYDSFDLTVVDITAHDRFPGGDRTPLPEPEPQDPAYIIYTSGTTGTPKGVVITHHNVPRIACDTNYLDVSPDDIFLQLSNYAFDGSTFDIYASLLNGAALVLTDTDTLGNARRLLDLIVSRRVTVFFITSALFNTLVELDAAQLSGVRRIFYGGERASVKHAHKALQILGPHRTVNVYGPTESTVFATFHPVTSVTPDALAIPIGNGVSGTGLWILDRHLKLQPIGVVGELYLSGHGLSAGYLNQPDLTAEKFPSLPSQAPAFHMSHLSHMSHRSHKTATTHQPPSTILYKTGDLCRRLPSGHLQFIDRIDQQVKIRGFRIELGEIEARMLSHQQVKEALATVHHDQTGGMVLCAYYSGSAETEQLSRHLSRDLPAYMIPAHLIQLDHFPISSATGKIDRKALPDPGSLQPRDAFTAPRDSLETQLADIWQDILKLERVGIHDDFFRSGGHSLKAVILTARIHRDFGVDNPVTGYFRQPHHRRYGGLYPRRSDQRSAAAPAGPARPILPALRRPGTNVHPQPFRWRQRGHGPGLQHARCAGNRRPAGSPTSANRFNPVDRPP